MGTAGEQNEKLIVDHLPLVGYVVSEVAGRADHLSRDDLAAAGAVALVEAARAFDAGRGVPFGAYARERIAGAVRDEMRRADWAGRAARRQITETLRAEEQLTASLGRTPTTAELADTLGVDRATAAQGLGFAHRTVSSLEDTMIEVVSPQLSPADVAIMRERLGLLRQAIDALPERLRTIIDEVYLKDRPVTEVAAELGVTHGAVSQQRAQAIALLRGALDSVYEDQPQSAPRSPRAVAYLDAFRLSVGRTPKTGNIA
ncbi:SigB/SigF/SigG family RNA polymerase sigma factor [Gryllotalpicola kribbensis]|uniref:SigB/SigF/SigG family RNA polymerase sigma factor n=1 Tax=Gryllotalpicola kribbensis TaxID=993084 RepID=A0ABP8ALR2_9MICO